MTPKEFLLSLTLLMRTSNLQMVGIGNRLYGYPWYQRKGEVRAIGRSGG